MKSILSTTPILIVFAFFFLSAKSDNITSLTRGATTDMLFLKGKMLDTVTEKDLYNLCSECALAIRFEIEDYEGRPRAIDLVVFDPNYDLHKFSVLNGVYRIAATKNYSGSKILIVPACKCKTKEDTPLLWCVNLEPMTQTPL